MRNSRPATAACEVAPPDLRDDRARDDHAGNVVGVGGRPGQYHVDPVIGQVLGLVARRHGQAGCKAWTGVHASLNTALLREAAGAEVLSTGRGASESPGDDRR